MKSQASILGQLLQLIDRSKFNQLVSKYKGDFKTHKLNCWSQFVSLFYAQLRGRNSLRDIEIGLESQLKKLYHLGLCQATKRTTLSDANNSRPYQIYEDLFYHQLKQCKSSQRGKSGPEIPISCLDSTVIKVCHSLFPWTKYGLRKGGLKLHFHYQCNSDLPEFMMMTDAQDSDLDITRKLSFKPDSWLLFDRGYYDFSWYYELHQKRVNFVTRTKSNLSYTKIGQHSEPSGSGVISDHLVTLNRTNEEDQLMYPEPIRYIRCQDSEEKEVVGFLTNNMTLDAETICELYRLRWKVEIFFRWIKQHLKIKTFLGTSRNAVLTQLWIALTLYLLLWYIRNQAQLKRTLHTLSRILDETAFEYISIFHILGFKPNIRPSPASSFPLFPDL